MIIRKICPNLEDLDPIKTDQKTKNIGVYPKVKDTTFNFHCPVGACLYNVNSEKHFSSLKFLRQHYRKVHAPKVYSCEVCQRAFPHPWDFKSHKDSCGRKFPCNVCNTTFSSKQTWQTHCRRKHHPRLPAIKNTGNTDKPQELVPESPNPSTIVLLVNCNPESAPEPADKCVSQRPPRRLLPKCPPVDPSPPPTEASINLSEVVTSSRPSTLTSQTQTEDLTEIRASSAVCSCGASKRKQQRNIQTQHGNFKRCKTRLQMANTATQTTIMERNCQNRNSKKSDKRSTQGQAVQVTWGTSGAGGVSLDSLDVIGNDSFDAFQLHAINDAKRCGTQVVNASADFSCINEMWCSNERQQRQERMESLGSLDVDVGLSLSMIASCATQTSPHAAGSTRMLSLQDLLNADSLQEREMVSVLQGTSSDVTHLNCETQTDKGYGCWVCDEHHKSVESDENTMFADIQTQTTWDLESIPYENLLTNMETQTGNACFLSDYGFSTIETQTQCETSNINDVSSLDSLFVDTHTQTKADVFQKVTQTYFTDTETQTLASRQVSDGRGVFTNSHTQTL